MKAGPMNSPCDSATDNTLLAAVRDGSEAAYAELYVRHKPPATAYARRLMRSAEDADDIVAETFTRVLGLLQRGAGPTGDFGPYLTRTVRNMCFDRLKAHRRIECTDDVAVLEAPTHYVDPADEAIDQRMAAQAFFTLPARWRKVLWLMCVQELNCADMASELGLRRTAMTSLTSRAREGLRQSYLLAHLHPVCDQVCAPCRAGLAAVVRGMAGPTSVRRVLNHASRCSACSADLDELRDVNAALHVGLSEQGSLPRVA